jgi:hypothetical protein
MPVPGDVQLTADGANLALCAYLDLLGDPLRYALAPCSLVMPASTILPAADADFDNRTFSALDPRFIRISSVRHGPGGAEAVAFTVSGTLEFDSDLLTLLSDPANFRGRTAKIWMLRMGADFVPTHARLFYQGYMAVPSVAYAPDEQSITVIAENYLSIVGSGAPARTLLSQKEYDSGDNSAAATLAVASSGNALGPVTGSARREPPAREAMR